MDDFSISLFGKLTNLKFIKANTRNKEFSMYELTGQWSQSYVVCDVQELLGGRRERRAPLALHLSPQLLHQLWVTLLHLLGQLLSSLTGISYQDLEDRAL